jgi:serine/threonine protein kinase
VLNRSQVSEKSIWKQAKLYPSSYNILIGLGPILGEGFFGFVRQTRLQSYNVEVAIKSLSPEGTDIQTLKVLCSELKMMMHIEQLGGHPNVVKFIGATTKNFRKSKVIISQH